MKHPVEMTVHALQGDVSDAAYCRAGVFTLVAKDARGTPLVY